MLSNPIIKCIQKISNKADGVEKISELKDCTYILADILERPPIQQLIEANEEIKRSKKDRCCILKNGILTDYESIENFMKKESSKAINICNNIIENKDSEQSHPYLEKAAYHFIAGHPELSTLIEPSRSGIDALIAWSFLNQAARNFLCTANKLSYEKEISDIKNHEIFLKDILYIKKNRYDFHNADYPRLKASVQNVSSKLVNELITLDAFSICNISNITFSSYCPAKDKTDAKITLKINNRKPIFFLGLRAENIYTILKNALKGDAVDGESDIEELKFSPKVQAQEQNKRKDAAHKEINAINIIIAKNWYNYGFIYGLNHLFYSDIYNYGVNPDIIHLIKESK